MNMVGWGRVAARGLHPVWGSCVASVPRGSMGLRCKAAMTCKSKRGRVLKSRSSASALIKKSQVGKLLKLNQGNVLKATKKAAKVELKKNAAALEAEANLRLRNSLVLRFSNENSYLNWARNGVLSSAVGVAMYAQEHHRGAQLSGAGLLLLGFGYIGVGTAKYIYYIFRFRHVMELSWASVFGTISHAAWGLAIWLTAIASFLESVPLELDAMLLTEPIASYLPFRIRQGLIETYSLHLDDLEHHNDEQERVMRAIRGDRRAPDLANVEEGEELPPQLEAQLIEQQLHTAPCPAVMSSSPPPL
ncbi:uncharacterized protein PHALS_07695 [Plasmopara halstedii]|uniref:Transmembrane protein n=1 Tax=Plasmopara halstedii TaxID=4781 RepID=A0A0P1B7W6_PLAHL|nr:uncharacterized protein PHALS_07695 [Plasmopara halstedii]CEG49960.1 hypothetical protein PHALS_07695 [Plasmopara halstedii]|eukprot:XP_024586329.1 hypothetical protein PHALS_07695 [Plasmopara halstedii]